MRKEMKATLLATVVTLLAVALIALISACGGSSGGGDDVAGHSDDEQVAEHAEDGHEGGSAVHVALNEWSITGAHDAAEALTAEAGDVVFEIHNEGAVPHDLKIIKTDLAADALPIADDVVDMEAAGEVIGGVDPLPGDIEVEEGYDLEPGRYVLICTIPGHYQQGMHAELDVH